jgi:hypothetical protein
MPGQHTAVDSTATPCPPTAQPAVEDNANATSETTKVSRWFDQRFVSACLPHLALQQHSLRCRNTEVQGIAYIRFALVDKQAGISYTRIKHLLVLQQQQQDARHDRPSGQPPSATRPQKPNLPRQCIPSQVHPAGRVCVSCSAGQSHS